jgi:hypothetical protein
MNGRHFHLVIEQNGRETVSSSRLSAEDAQSLLAIDKLLHRAAGWRVTEARGVVVAVRGHVVRFISSRRCEIGDDREAVRGVGEPPILHNRPHPSGPPA